MKNPKAILIIFLVLVLSIKVTAQETQMDKEKKERKVKIFTNEESDNFQLWFYNETKKMNLSEAAEEEYYRIILHYSFDLNRLNDKDKDYTSDEMRKEFEKILVKMNSEVKEVLTEENYKVHINNWDIVLKPVYERMGWDME